MIEQELRNWKENLEGQRNDILKRQHLLEKRKEKNEIIWQVTQEVSPQDRDVIAQSAQKAHQESVQELARFNNENQSKLKEIEAYLAVIEQKLVAN